MKCKTNDIFISVYIPKMTEAQTIVQERYEKLQSLNQFKMLDKVSIVSGFYEWQTGVIFAESEFVRNPNQDINELYPEGICTVYKVAIQDKEEKTIDIREVEARHIVLQS